VHRADQIETLNNVINPLDSVEDVLTANEWTFNRMNMDEIIVQVAGKCCNYRLIFVWQEDMNAIQFCCQYDMVITPNNTDITARTLMAINSKLWMGSFIVDNITHIPTFRHTLLNHGDTPHTACFENIEALIDIALTQCERYQAAFDILAQESQQKNILDNIQTTAPMIDEQIMSLALMETLGES